MVEQLTLDLAWLRNLPLLWFPLKLAGLRSLCKWAGVTTQSGLQILKVLQCSVYSRVILVLFILVLFIFVLFIPSVVLFIQDGCLEVPQLVFHLERDHSTQSRLLNFQKHD